MRKLYVVFCEVVNKRSLELSLGEKEYQYQYNRLIAELQTSKKYDFVIVKDYQNFHVAFDEINNPADRMGYIDEVLLSLGKENSNALMTIYKGVSIEASHSDVNNALMALHLGIKNQRRLLQYNDMIALEILEANEIKNQLVRATIEDNLCILYQPKVSISTKQVVGFEALLRLRNKSGGFYMTERVIKAAKEYNLMHCIDQFLISQVMKDYKIISEFYPNCTISINLTVKELELNYHQDLLIKHAKESNFPLNKLYIEITQDEEIMDLSLIKNVLESFKKDKIKLSIDDFGSKYNNFYRLERIKYDEIKIDKSITDRYIEYPSILKFMSNLFVGLGYEVVIEGVETIDQLNELPNSQNLFLQGYLYSRPIPLINIGLLGLS